MGNWNAKIGRFNTGNEMKGRYRLREGNANGEN